MVKSIRYQLGNTDLELEPQILSPEITPDIIRTLSMLMGYQPVTGRFSLIDADSQGSLLVNTSREYNPNYIATEHLVNTAATQFLQVNNERKEVLVNVKGPSGVLFADSAARLAIAIEIVNPGQYINLINFTGELWMRNLGGSSYVLIGEYF